MSSIDRSINLIYSKSPNKYAGETPMTQATTNYQEEASFPTGGVPDFDQEVSPNKSLSPAKGGKQSNLTASPAKNPRL